MAGIIDFDRLEQVTAPNFSAASGKGNIGAVVTAATPYIFTAAGFLLLLYLLAGGIQLMLSGGNPQKVTAAWGKITNALLGFTIIFLAYWIVTAVGLFFGIEQFSEIFTNTIYVPPPT